VCWVSQNLWLHSEKFQCGRRDFAKWLLRGV